MFPVPLRVRNDFQLPFFFSVTGGALILLQGLLSVGWSGHFGELGILVGLAVLAGAAALRRPTRYRTISAGLVLGLSLLSFFVVSGFYLGAVLGVIGGGMVLASGDGPPFTISGRGRRSPSLDLGPLCPKCSHHIPTWSPRCPYCESSP
ncbi:MAG: hypothetical protein L3K09_04205 [Thermoplasmata archaeon]|nr:hypothetical protein [Thermoplasmata archaeon]